jgi:hypothetical protein
MATIMVQLRQAMNAPFNRKWSNVFFVDAGFHIEAAAIGLDIWATHLRPVFSPGVFCYAIYVNNVDDPPGTPGYLSPVDPGQQRGQAAGGWDPNNALPLFNAVRVDIAVAQSRPSRKFLRPGLQEGSITAGQLSAGYTTALKAAFDAICGMPTTVDVDGQKWQSSVVIGLTPKRLGKFAGVDVPEGPAFG